MAVGSDLAGAREPAEYKAGENSMLPDVTGRQIGVLDRPENRVLVPARRSRSS